MSTVIGVFADRNQAERAVNSIRESGITEDEISILARQDAVRGDDEGQNLTEGAVTGGTLGGIAGLMAGAGALTIPGIGPILAAGPIAAGLSGVAAGGLAGSLVDLGIPEERGRFFEEEVRRGRIIASVETDRSKEDEVASQMKRNRAQNVEVH